MFWEINYETAQCSLGCDLIPTAMLMGTTPAASCKHAYSTITKGEFRRLFKRSFANFRTQLRRERREHPEEHALVMSGYRDKKGKQHVKIW